MSRDPAEPPASPPTVALCPVCAESTASFGDTQCPRCAATLLLHGRYHLRRLLGGGGQGHTFSAFDEQSGGEVAIKELSLAYVRDWKSVDLFRRQAQVLGSLQHPSVPRLHEYFEEERNGVTFFYLVQELIDGQSFAQELAGGRRYDEVEVVAIARAVLEVLGYLHGLVPPIIHRDLKPSNLMRRRNGRLVLIDFGLVRDHARPEGGSTVAAGTPGYTPLEQYSGFATPATDLYALGATMVALLARAEPSSLMKPGQIRLDFSRHVQVSPALAEVMNKLLEPEPEARYQSAREVLEALAPRPEPAEPADDEEEATPVPKVPARRGRFAGWTAFIVLGSLAFVFTPTCPVVVGKLAGYHALVMDALRRCDEAGTALGANLSVSSVGCMGNGSASCGDGDGQAAFSYPVSGSLGSGRYRFDVVKQDSGPWKLVRARLSIGKRTIDVVACAWRAGAAAVPPTMIAPSLLAAPSPPPGGPAATLLRAQPPGLPAGLPVKDMKVEEASELKPPRAPGKPANGPLGRKRGKGSRRASATPAAAEEARKPEPPPDPAVLRRQAEYARVLAALRTAIADGEPDYDTRLDRERLRRARLLLEELRTLDSGEATTRAMENEYRELSRYHSGKGPIRQNRMPADEYQGADAAEFKKKAGAVVREKNPRLKVVAVSIAPADWKHSPSAMSLEAHVCVQNQRGRYWVYRVYIRRNLKYSDKTWSEPRVSSAGMYPYGLTPENAPR